MMASTSSLCIKKERMVWAKKKRIRLMTTVIMVVTHSVFLNPSLTLGILAAPIFCPVKVESAMAKFIEGSRRKVSNLIAIP